MSSRIPTKPAICIGLARGEEPVGDAALVEHLDGPRVQPAGARRRRPPGSARRSTTTTSTPASASSPASIRPVGPAPAITTPCSVIPLSWPRPGRTGQDRRHVLEEL